ncbi:MAG: PAS domain-containing protein [Alphaproteobacteria bacterium]|nr:PAS domain-containing protein [Alphaproteobacteria bacterium]
MSRDVEVLNALGDASKTSLAFARYWLSLDPIDLIPSRAHFLPESIPRLLANLGIHELISPEFIKLRLVGTAVVDDYGQEITWRNYLDFVEEERRPKASRALHLVCEQPCGMIAQLRSTTVRGGTLTRESIAFPMRNEEGIANLVYFCSTPAQERETFIDERTELRVANVLDRYFIDIGAGVPDFQD